LALVPRWWRRIPVVATLHGWASTRPFTRLWLYEWVDRKSLKALEGVVAVNESMLQRLARQVKARALVIPNGVAPFRDGLLERDSTDGICSFCKEGFIVGSIGRLSPEKGYGSLVRAVQLLRAQGVEAKLVILGEGHERKRIEELIGELHLAREVLLPGY